MMDNSIVSKDILLYPRDNNFDNETAKILLERCATIIIEDMPIGTQFGIDVNTYNTAQKFMGIKMIPPGLHLIHYSSVDRSGVTAPRTAFFHYFKSGEVIVRKWNKFNEDIENIDSVEQQNRFVRCASSGQMDDRLGAYQFNSYNTWVGLTDYITLSIFNRLNPICGKINSVSRMITPNISQVNHNYDTIKDKDGLPIMETDPNFVIRFTAIPTRNTYPLGSTATEITRHNLDSTYTLEQMLSKYEHECEILGEFQFAFVNFFMAHVYDSFEHWRLLLKLLCTCEEALEKYPDIYFNFIRVLHFQLKHIPDDMFVDIVENNNFLVHSLRVFFSNVFQSTKVNDSIKQRVKRFQINVTHQFKWDFTAENDDELPIIVDVV